MKFKGLSLPGIWAYSLGVFLAWMLTTSCTSSTFPGRDAFETTRWSVETVHLWNPNIQQSLPGDWLLRRKHLALVDDDLRRRKPDMVVGFGLLGRLESPFEDDAMILGAGALRGYQWQRQQIFLHPFSDEIEWRAVAVSLPLRPLAVVGDRHASLTMVPVLTPLQPILVEAGQLPTHLNKVQRQKLEAELRAGVQAAGTCLRRVVLVLSWSQELLDKPLVHFLEQLGFVDSALGFCDLQQKCATATPQNPLFRTLAPGKAPMRLDRIYVHESARVVAAGRTLMGDGSWEGTPAPHYGWSASVQLAACPDTIPGSVASGCRAIGGSQYLASGQRSGL